MARSMKVSFGTIKWDFPAVKVAAAKKLSTTLRSQIQRQTQARLSRIEEQMIAAIKSHPVTQEILEGENDPVNGPNLSGTLGGYGNLWAFIGFYEGDDPIGDVIGSVENKHRVLSVYQEGSRVRVEGSSADIQQVYENTPMPWAKGRSWAESIHQGISGFGRYLSTDDPKSRSGGGLQIQNQLRTGGYKNVSYLAPIFNESRRRINDALKKGFKFKD